MKLTLHIFHKDVRHLWREILVVLAALALLTWADLLRYDRTPTALEGILNLLLPVTWFCLLAMLVQNESPIGDRQLWLSWPYSWSSLLAAKLVFALAFVQLPYFVSSVVIVSGHGFSLLAALPALLQKQWLVAALVTIPALALASITRNIAHFLLSAIAVVIAGLALSGGADRFDVRLDQIEGARLAGLAAALLIISTAILLIQYPFRRLALARLAAIAGIATCVLVATRVPTQASRPLPRAGRALPTPSRLAPGHLSLVLDGNTPPAASETSLVPPPPLVALRIPVRLQGAPKNMAASLTTSRIQVRTADGTIYEGGRDSVLFHLPAGAFIAEADNQNRLELVMSAPFYEQVRNQPVTLTVNANALLIFDRLLLRLSPGQGVAAHPALGRCRTVPSKDVASQSPATLLVCENTAELKRPMTIAWAPGGTPLMPTSRASFNTTWAYPNYPTRTWLSPLFRATGLIPSRRTGDIEIRTSDYDVYNDLELNAPNLMLSRYRVGPEPEPSARTRAK